MRFFRDTSVTEEDVVKVFEEAVASVPSGCLQVAIDRQPPFDGIEIRIVPTRAEAAPITARITERLIFMQFALCSLYELPYRTLLRNSREQLAALKELCLAVLENGMEETIWLSRGDIVRCRGRIKVKGVPVNLYYSRPLRCLLSKTEKKVHLYPPYC